MPTIRVAVAGATGYTGEELIRLLLKHPNVQLTYLAASAKWERPVALSEVYPRFARQLDLPVEALDPARLSKAADVIFLALPHGTAMSLAPGLLDAGCKVIDLSGDFRLRDPSLYPRWYQFDHPHPKLLTNGTVAYGLTEFHREEITRARLIANPGCYATSILLATIPLLQAKLLDEPRLTIDAKSGFSGAGRQANMAEITDNLRAYKVNNHQHMPEVLQELQQLTGQHPVMTFVPQVLSVTRGLISTIYVRTRQPLEAIQQAFAAAYPNASAPFVRVRAGTLPQLRDVIETNFCDIGLIAAPEQETLILGSALDNLTKGAAGQAVQNFNLMHGFPETTALN